MSTSDESQSLSDADGRNDFIPCAVVLFSRPLEGLVEDSELREGGHGGPPPVWQSPRLALARNLKKEQLVFTLVDSVDMRLRHPGKSVEEELDQSSFSDCAFQAFTCRPLF